MTTSTLGVFRYAGIAALPICVALAFVAGMTDRSANARDAAAKECIVDETRHAYVDPAPTRLDEVPLLGELTVTGTRIKSVL
jgi:hypothetical protein